MDQLHTAATGDPSVLFHLPSAWNSTFHTLLSLWCGYHVFTGCSLWGAPHLDSQTQCGTKLPLRSVFLQQLSWFSNLLICLPPLKFTIRNGRKERHQPPIPSLSLLHEKNLPYLFLVMISPSNNLLSVFCFFFRHQLHIVLYSYSLVTKPHNVACTVKGL